MQLYCLARPLGKLAQPCAEVLACSAPAGADVLCCLAGMFPLCLLAFLRCSPQSCTALPLLMEVCWAAPLGSAGVLCMHLSLHTCRLNTAKGHGSITELHLPHSTAPPSPPHRSVYWLFPVKQVFLLHSILLYRFLRAPSHISTLLPFSSLSLAPCLWMALVDTAEISRVCFVSPVPRFRFFLLIEGQHMCSIPLQCLPRSLVLPAPSLATSLART